METLSEHYGRLLGLMESWVVEGVDLRLDERRVEIRLRHAGEGVTCPECGEVCPLADHASERRWRHLDTMQFATELVARLPRSHCREHGVKTVVPPWAGKHSRFTLLFEAFAIEVLKMSRTIHAAALLLNLDWNAVQAIMTRAVERGLARRTVDDVRRVGLDEKSFGQGHDYITVLSDIDGSRVLEVTPDRTQKAAEEVLEKSLSPSQRSQVRAVAADMLPAYAKATKAKLPQAELVHDKFHVAKHLGEAVDQVRRAENKALLAINDDRLKGTRQLWLFGKPNLSSKQRRAFESIQKRGLKTARAWMLKEQFRWFWRYVYASSAEVFFDRWYAWAIRSRLAPIKKVARMLHRHLPGLLSYFRHGITNAVSEGYNSVIQALRYAARGFRSFDNYRTRILFACGKLQLKP
jgi:transposase